MSIPQDAAARKRAGAARGRETMKRRREAVDTTFAASVTLRGLGSAYEFFKALEPLRSEVYARVKHAKDLALHASGKAPAPAPIPKQPPVAVVVPSDGFIVHEGGRAGVRFCIEPGDAPPVKAGKPVSHLRNFRNEISKAPCAQRLLEAVGVEHFNAKLHASNPPPVVWKLPKDGVALKGAGANSEATAKAVGQAVRALAERIVASVKKTRGAEEVFARLHTAAAADPSFLLTHEATRGVFASGPPTWGLP